jgi:hypothetical protein
MVVPFEQAIPSILALTFSSIILILLALNYILNKFLPTLLLIFFFVGMDLWSLTKLVSVFLPSITNSTFVLIWKIASLSILIVSLLIISYFRDLLVYDSLGPPSTVITFFAGFTLASLWWGDDFATVNFNPVSGWNTDYQLLFQVILIVYLLIVYTFMFIMLIRGLVKATNKKQKQQIAFIITGLAIAALGGTVVNYLLNSIPAFNTLGDFDLIFVVIGFAIVAFAYLRSPIQIYFAPVTAHRLIVVTNDGIPILSHDFCEKGEKALTIDTTLISGALSGVVGILKETLQSESTPNTIQLEDRVLLLEKKGKILCALIAEEEVMALRAALKDFANEFEKGFGHKLVNWQGLTDEFNDALRLIEEDFAFVITSSFSEGEEECQTEVLEAKCE